MLFLSYSNRELKSFLGLFNKYYLAVANQSGTFFPIALGSSTATMITLPPLALISSSNNTTTPPKITLAAGAGLFDDLTSTICSSLSLETSASAFSRIILASST